MREVLAEGGKPDELEEVAGEAGALAAPTPSISSGNSTLPMTVRHGSRPKFWNTMQSVLARLGDAKSRDGDAILRRRQMSPASAAAT